MRYERKDKEKEEAPGQWDFRLPSVWFPNQVFGLPVNDLMFCVFTFEIFSASLADVMGESTLF